MGSVKLCVRSQWMHLALEDKRKSDGSEASCNGQESSYSASETAVKMRLSYLGRDVLHT